jgi:hypothetical protein
LSSENKGEFRAFVEKFFRQKNAEKWRAAGTTSSGWQRA